MSLHFILHFLNIDKPMLFDKINLLLLNDDVFIKFNSIETYRDKGKILNKNVIDKRYNELLIFLNNDKTVNQSCNNRRIIFDEDTDGDANSLEINDESTNNIINIKSINNTHFDNIEQNRLSKKIVIEDNEKVNTPKKYKNLKI